MGWPSSGAGIREKTNPRDGDDSHHQATQPGFLQGSADNKKKDSNHNGITPLHGDLTAQFYLARGLGQPLSYPPRN